MSHSFPQSTRISASWDWWTMLIGIATVVTGLTLPLPASAQETATATNSLEMGCLNARLSCVGIEQEPADDPYDLRRAIARAALRQAEAPPSAAVREDGTFQIVMGAFITAAGTDIATSMYHIGQGTAREVGFGGWWQDSPVAFAVTKSAVTALFAYQLQKLHKSRPKTALILGVIGTGFEAALVARTARIGSHAR